MTRVASAFLVAATLVPAARAADELLPVHHLAASCDHRPLAAWTQTVWQGRNALIDPAPSDRGRPPEAEFGHLLSQALGVSLNGAWARLGSGGNAESPWPDGRFARSLATLAAAFADRGDLTRSLRLYEAAIQSCAEEPMKVELRRRLPDDAFSPAYREVMESVDEVPRSDRTLDRHPRRRPMYSMIWATVDGLPPGCYR